MYNYNDKYTHNLTKMMYFTYPRSFDDFTAKLCTIEVQSCQELESLSVRNFLKYIFARSL